MTVKMVGGGTGNNTSDEQPEQIDADEEKGELSGVDGSASSDSDDNDDSVVANGGRDFFADGGGLILDPRKLFGKDQISLASVSGILDRQSASELCVVFALMKSWGKLIGDWKVHRL